MSKVEAVRPPVPVHHGQMHRETGINPPESIGFGRGKFGRLFPALHALPDTEPVREALLELGKPGGLMDAGDSPQDRPDTNAANRPNPEIPAGFTFFGQFVDHDVTFDPTSSLERQNDLEAIENFRTPSLGLDNVYGSGPAATPFLYDQSDPGKFLIEKLSADEGARDDLPRNAQNVALIGDPRNDENLIVGQLHLAFLKFHNVVVDQLRSDDLPPQDVFKEAQRLVRWHYQWIVLREFLPHIVGEDVLNDVLENGRKFYNWRSEPFIPIEFSIAAYRFGHSQVRPGYLLNSGFGAPVFDANEDASNPDPGDCRGGKRAGRRFVEQGNFFQVNGGRPLQSKLIDTKLSTPLFALPFVPPNMPTNPQSLAQRNLLRGITFRLPSGQRVARAMRLKPLDREVFADLENLGARPGRHLARETPLWFYILKEAEVGGGTRLGPVGGRIVAEVFVGLLEGDRMSYLRQAPDWEPEFGTDGTFTMADLLTMAKAP